MSQQLSEDTSQQHHLSEEEEDSVPSPPRLLFHRQSASSPRIEPHNTLSTTDSLNTPAFKNKYKQQTLTDVDKSFKDYMDAKRIKLDNHTRGSHAKKQLLDSLLPKIKPLIEMQMRSFRCRILHLTDKISSTQD